MSRYGLDTSAEGLSQLREHLHQPTTQAVLSDQFHEAMMPIPMFESLLTYDDPQMATEHLRFVQEGNGPVYMLCTRPDPNKVPVSGTPDEALLSFPALLWKSTTMPFASAKDLRKEEAYAPSGSQSIVLPILDIYEMNRVRAAIDVVWVMASLAVPQDTLRPPPREYVVDGEMSICISNPIATHRDHQGTAVQVPIPPILDPKGIVANWVERSNRVVTEDNIVDYYQVTEHGKMAGEYKMEDCPGSKLRRGQIVRVQVGFRVVPAGNKWILKMELKSVSIMSESICEELAFDPANKNKRGAIMLAAPGPSHVIKRARTKRGWKATKVAALDKTDADDDTMSGDLQPLL